MAHALKLRGTAYDWAPQPFATELKEWVEFGERPDSRQLVAIMENDLHATIAYGGDWLIVRDTLNWLSKVAPGSFGSAEVVRAWRRSGGLDGQRMMRGRA